MTKKVTHEEHVELAAALYPAFRVVSKACAEVSNKLGKTNKATKKLVQVLYAFERARSELDNAYHAVTEDTQFEAHGHVYYGGRNDR